MVPSSATVQPSVSATVLSTSKLGAEGSSPTTAARPLMMRSVAAAC